MSEEIREEAALICAIAASWPRDQWVDYPQISGYIDGGLDALTLAMSAWAYVVSHEAEGLGYRGIADAHAESLIRTGWTP